MVVVMAVIIIIIIIVQVSLCTAPGCPHRDAAVVARARCRFAGDGIKFYSLPHLKCYLKERKKNKEK